MWGSRRDPPRAPQGGFGGVSLFIFCPEGIYVIFFGGVGGEEGAPMR